MAKESYRSSRPDSWTMPRAKISDGCRQHYHGRLRPMGEKLPSNKLHPMTYDDESGITKVMIIATFIVTFIVGAGLGLGS